MNSRQANGVLQGNGDSRAQFRLLGFMEQKAMYDAGNFNICAFNDNTTVGDAIDSTATHARLGVFLCPSAAPPSWIITGGPYNWGNSYFASTGPSLEHRYGQAGGKPNGMFTTTARPSASATCATARATPSPSASGRSAAAT